MHPNAYVVKALISKDRISWILRTRVSRIEIYFRAAKFTIYPKKRKNNCFGRCWIAFKSIRLWNSDSLLRRGGGGDSCISALEDGSFLINRVNICLYHPFLVNQRIFCTWRIQLCPWNFLFLKKFFIYQRKRFSFKRKN